ncbi:Crp/Fnr family transcriptional regulator [Hellea balneolensis]|uniref:Crp/Fnr family transcriptional regulator n=1 Tax=Hellea balneolensis TaxID=287478 RepID=UPI00041C7ABB|nr:Crp/Fnr family transcriptional regulator [Hellea balneolensis]
MDFQYNILDFQRFLAENADIHAAFSDVSQSRKIAKGNIIVAQDEPGQDIFLLRVGRAKAVIFSEGGHEIHLAEFMPGTLFGEMAALLNAPRSSNVIAHTKAVVDVIPAAEFNTLMRRHPKLALYMTQMLAKRLQQTSQSLFEGHVFTVTQRIYQDLLRKSEPDSTDTERMRLAPAPSVTSLSKSLNVTREAASRAVTKLTKQGLVKKQKGYWDIIRPEF